MSLIKRTVKSKRIRKILTIFIIIQVINHINMYRKAKKERITRKINREGIEEHNRTTIPLMLIRRNENNDINDLKE